MAVLAPVLGVFSLRSRTSKDEREHLVFHRRTVLSVLHNLRRSWLQGFVVILDDPKVIGAIPTRYTPHLTDIMKSNPSVFFFSV